MTLSAPKKERCDSRACFPRILSDWMKRHGLESKRVAAELGVSRATLSYWCDGSRFPSMKNLQTIADYTGLPLCQLICDQCQCAYWANVAAARNGSRRGR